MSAIANGLGVEEHRFTHSVIAVCDDESGTVAINSLELGKSFVFDAICMPPAAVLFRLSISLTNESTVYLQLVPDRISSLKKTTCDHRNNKCPPCFDDIRRHLDGHRSFTRLQFQLSSRGDLIAPAGFALDRCDAEARRKFVSVASLATALTFSLYMPRDVLPKAKYQIFYQAYRRSSTLTAAQDLDLMRMGDLRKFYKGKGGVLYSLENHHDHLSRVPEAAAVPDATGSPPEYDDIKGRGSPLPKSQQLTVSESDATVAVTTPSEYDNDEAPSQLPPPYVEAHGSKRNLSGDSENVNLHRLKKRKSWSRAAGTLSRSQFPSVDLTHPKRRIKALEVRMEKQEKQLEQLRADMVALQSRNDDLEERHDDMEGNHETIVGTLESVDVHVDELEQECEVLKEQLPEIRQELEDWQGTVHDYVESWVEDNIEAMLASYMEKYLEDKAKDFTADLKRKFRSVLDDEAIN